MFLEGMIQVFALFSTLIQSKVKEMRQLHGMKPLEGCHLRGLLYPSNHENFIFLQRKKLTTAGKKIIVIIKMDINTST